MTDQSPPFTALRAVEAAARHRSFTWAARELNVTHSAVSQAVKRLESDLGVQLFARRGGGMEPSEAALRLAQTYSGAAEALSLLIREISGQTSPDDMQLSAPAEFLDLWLAPRAARLRAALPDFHVRTADLDGPPEIVLERAAGAVASDVLAPARVVAAWRSDTFDVAPTAAADLRSRWPLTAMTADDALAWSGAHGGAPAEMSIMGGEAIAAALDGRAIVVGEALLIEPMIARGELIAWPQPVATTTSWTLRSRVGPAKAAMADRLRLWFQLEVASAEASLRRAGLSL